jgi:hypothetical protein
VQLSEIDFLGILSCGGFIRLDGTSLWIIKVVNRGEKHGFGAFSAIMNIISTRNQNNEAQIGKGRYFLSTYMNLAEYKTH